MDAELSYLLFNQENLRIPAGRIALYGSQLITNSATNIGVFSISALENASTVTLTTQSSHGLVPGEVVTIANNLTNSSIATIIGDGTTAIVTTTTPHVLQDNAAVTIANNTVNLSGASIVGDGSTATVTTTTNHGFVTGNTASISYNLPAISSGIVDISGDGSAVTVNTSSPHTLTVGENVTVYVPSGSGSISSITPNTPSSGNALVVTSNAPTTAVTVTIAGGSAGYSIIYQGTAPGITTSGNTGTTTATVVVNEVTLPYGVSTGNTVNISGVSTSGNLSEIVGSPVTGFTVWYYTQHDHGLVPGSSFTVNGLTGTNSKYNGTWTVDSCPSSTIVQVRTAFSSFDAFLTSATWSGNSGFNGNQIVTSTGTVVIGSKTYPTFSFSTTCYFRTTNHSTMSIGYVGTQASPYGGTYTITPISSTSFSIPSTQTQIAYGGTWSYGTGFSGTYAITTVPTSLSLTYASTIASSASGGNVSGVSGFTVTGANITVNDSLNFTYDSSIDTSQTPVVGFNVTGLSGFNGLQTGISYIDGYNFSYLNSANATIAGGNISSLSGFNNSPVTVLSVPSPATFTYENQLAGTSLPYVFGNTFSTGTVTTYDTAYTGVTQTEITWSQPAVFCVNGMIASGDGFTVPKTGWYKVIGRAELSSTSSISYGNLTSGSYAYMDIYANDTLIARSNQINQQTTALEYGVLVSDLVYLTQNESVTAVITAYATTNSGQVYAWGNGTTGLPNLTYLSIVYVSP